MKITFFKRIILISAFVCSFLSCSSDMDVDQVNDFYIQPVFTANLAYLNKNASDFISNGAEVPFFYYTAKIDFLTSSFVEDNLVKAELYFRIKNTVPRAYTYEVTFFDIDDKPIHKITMDVPASNGSEVVVENTQTFTTANVDILKNTNKMFFSVRMHQGPPITANTPGRVELSSSFTSYFDTK